MPNHLHRNSVHLGSEPDVVTQKRVVDGCVDQGLLSSPHVERMALARLIRWVVLRLWQRDEVLNLNGGK